MAAITRLGLCGFTRGLYGSFAGKALDDAPPPAVATPGGGGRRRIRRGRYPRRILIDGRTHWVNSAAEEKALLAAYQAQLEAEALALEAVEAPKAQVAKVKVAIARTERRIDEAEERRKAWLERLRREDDEILMLLH